MTEAPAVLLVEDDPDLRALSTHVLTNAGYAVTVAANGVEALSLLDTVTPALVVLDVQMPDIDGWTVLEAIRTHPRHTSTPVLMCTVKTALEDEARAGSLQPDGHLAKPYTINAFQSAVGRLARV